MANEKLVNRENLKAFREKYDDRLTSGQLVVSKSLTAKELETISPESGDTQETPFALQGTGTANGTSSVDTGTVGKHIQKQGSVYCVNQQIVNGNFVNNTTGWSGYSATYTVSSNVATITPTAVDGRIQQTLTRVVGHKYLTYAWLKGANGVQYSFNGLLPLTTANGSWQFIYKLVEETSATKYFQFMTTEESDFQQFQVKDVNSIDLTQWFNGNIPQDLLDHPEHWSWYQTYGDYIPYNTGTLVASNGKWLVCGVRNVWDEKWEQGNIKFVDGQNEDSTLVIRSKNYIRVIPTQTYYFYCGDLKNHFVFAYDYNKNFIDVISYDQANGTFTTPANCYFIRFRMPTAYGNTYKHDITISLYYAGEDYSQYYPYEQPKVYDTGDEDLLSTGVKLSVSGEREDIYDYKEPNGTIHRLVKNRVLTGAIDESWSLQGQSSSDPSFYSFYITIDAETAPTTIVISNCCTNLFEYLVASYTTTTKSHFMLQRATGGTILYVRTNKASSVADFKTWLSTHNLEINWETATPTTEQGTPFSDYIEINDFGTMGWYATYTDANTNALVSVPQGCKIFYPAWYVGFIDTLGQRADIDWNANNVVSQSELASAFKNDVSSGLTDSAGLTYVLTKIYKLGNMVFLTIRADNKTGSSIALGTTLFALGSGLVATSTLRVFANVSGTNTNAVINSNGNVSVDSAIANNQTLFICCSYAVA